MEGVFNIILTRFPISLASAPRIKGIFSHCSANFLLVCLLLFIVGPGPIAFTLMLGAKAKANVCVRVHKADLDMV